MRSFSSGFAYLWTLLLIAFLGVSTLIASHVYQTSVRREEERQLLFVGHEFRNAIGRYYEQGQHQYPATLEELLQDGRSAHLQRHLRRIYADPITGKDNWELVRQNGRIVGLHSVSDKTPIKQGNFDPMDSVFLGKSKYSDWVFLYPHNLILPDANGSKPGEGKPGENGKIGGLSGLNDTGVPAPASSTGSSQPATSGGGLTGAPPLEITKGVPIDASVPRK